MQQIARKLKKATTHLEAGDFSKAEVIVKAILRKSSDNLDSLNLLAVIAMRRDDYAKARKILQHTVTLNPKNSSLLFNLGLACSKLELLDESVRHLHESIHLTPSFEPAQSLLCHVSCQIFQLDEAIEAGQTAIKLAPLSFIAHTNLAAAYEAWGNLDLAFEHYKKAAELAPNQVQTQFNLASAYLSAGSKGEAKQYLTNTIRIQPTHTGALRQLARLTRYTSPDHADFTDYKHLLASNSLADNERSELYFALGKMYQDCKIFDIAFENYLAGNKIEHERLGFRIDEFVEKVTDLKAFYTRARLKKHTETGNPDKSPLFIVGMPRSGTSLVEQILASHSAIFGAGERSWFWRMESIIGEYLQSSKSYPECTKGLDLDASSKLSNKFLEHLKIISKAEDHTYIIDKNPGNFERLGLIWQLFPNARVIHCQRNPMDTCVSIFTLLFPEKILYGYDLYTLGAYYAQYERLMEHWQKLRPEQIFNIKYEDLIAEQEPTTRKLIDFLGLPWDESCLHYYENKRNVRTASDFQVRKPIYTSSIDRWKNYEQFLDPLKAGFKAH
ncbi:MAG: sulfotransferase [Gammaproteobacteria bacterium]|nr:sulfotransferase [Gammaproteobacteria bacterium]